MISGIEHWLPGAGRKTHEELQFDGSTVSVLRNENFWKCVVQYECG